MLGGMWPDFQGHPLGVKPLGERMAKLDGNIRDSGLGVFAVLSDELVLAVLSCMSAKSLVNLSAASKSFYVFCNHEDLWKALTIQEHEGGFNFQASWKDTYIWMMGVARPSKLARRALSDQAGQRSVRKECRLKVSGFYSDVLYQAYHCATAPIQEDWLARDNIPRRSNLTADEFRKEFELPNMPVLLTDCPETRDACKRWNRKYLMDKLKGLKAIAGDMEIATEDFFQYVERQSDDMPLYMFDKQFAERCPELAQDYGVPRAFGEDLFGVLGSSRPDYRWLIIGPPRSGSTFHVDPNSTSAWNAAICGRKKWILFPPSVVPPGVIPSVDGANVATPVSIIEWFLNFYDECKEHTFFEGIAQPGEVMFVPRGWWHCVLNLDFSVAITQNFVSSVNLHHVLTVLKSPNSELISGCDDEEKASLYARFLAALRNEHPSLAAGWDEHEASVAQAKETSTRLVSLFQPAEQLTGRQKKVDEKEKPQESTRNFSFAFNL